MVESGFEKFGGERWPRFMLSGYILIYVLLSAPRGQVPWHVRRKIRKSCGGCGRSHYATCIETVPIHLYSRLSYIVDAFTEDRRRSRIPYTAGGWGQPATLG